MRKRGITDLDRRCRSTRGPPGTFGYRRRGRPAHHRAASPTCATTRPTTATPARSKACIVLRRHGARRGARGHRPRRRADAARARASYYPATTRRCAPTCSPLDITQPEGPSFTVDGHLITLAAVVAAGRVGSVRRARAAHRRLRRRRPHCARSCTARRSARWSCPTATPARCTAGRTRSTPASGASAAWPTRSRSAATASARSTTSTRCSPTSTASPPRSTQRHLHARGGLRHPLEALGPARRHDARCGARAGSCVSSIATVGNYEYGFYWYFYLDGIDPARGEAHRDHVHEASRRRRRPRTQRRSPRAWPRRSTSTCSARGSTWTSTAPTTRCTRSRSSRCRGRRQPVGQRVPRRTRPGSTPSGRRSATRSRREPHAGRSSIPSVAQPARRSPWRTSSSRCDAHPAGRPGVERRPPRRVRHHNLWVTPYAPDERRAAGDYPNQHAGGDGLPAWTAADRSLVDTDVVRLAHVRRHPRRRDPRTGR